MLAKSLIGGEDDLMVDQEYEVGMVVEGIVSVITPFGAFIQLEPVIEGISSGVSGLLHILDISEDQKANIEHYIQLEQIRLFKIKEIDRTRVPNLISLTIRGMN